MTFHILSTYFERLEGTTKRLELITILSELFKSLDSSEEARDVGYLIQGRVAAFYEPIEFGMGERLLERVVAEYSGLSVEEVHGLNGQKGDLSAVVDTLHNTTAIKRADIVSVFTSLRTLPAISGEGSIEDKVQQLSSLLKKLDSLSVRYVLRIVSGNLRLGVGDATVLEALSLAYLGDRKYRGELERAYNQISDLGVIAEVLGVRYLGLGSSDEEKVQTLLHKIGGLGISVGRPLRSELCERLPNAEKTIEKMGEVVSQFKYDGFRTQMHLDRKNNTVKLFSRNLEETTHAFPELLQGVLNQVDAESVILDSEALAYHVDSEEFFPFQETTKRRRKHGIEAMAEQLPLRAFVFDILYKDGVSLVDLPVKERLKILRETVKGMDTLIVSESRFISDPKELGLMLEEALTKGLEGLVVKKVDSPYEAGGRNFNWVKLKHTASEQLKDTVDCVVLGYIYGRGKRTAFGVGALLVGLYDKDNDMFVSVSKIGTGLTDAEWVEVRERCDTLVSEKKPARVDSNIEPSVWVNPEVVIEVLADEITRSPSHTAGKTETEPGYALRFPRLISFRDKDKRGEDATSVKEIKELYSLQGKKE